MLKKILLIIILLNSFIAEAGVWEAVGNCFSDPCNCGITEKLRYEQVDILMYVYKRDPLCPPWFKENGREARTCLLNKAMPKSFIGYYENLCAEATPESSYTEPKIKVRGQQCNALTCWTTNNTLGWDGECVTLSGGYVFPLHRMCARVAMPADPINDVPPDPGYTYAKHLDRAGISRDDKPIITEDGQKIILEPPKLCLYKDPSFFSFKGGLDLMDLDPNKQPLHRTSETHPIVKVIIFLINGVAQLGGSIADLLGQLFSGLGGDDDDETTFGSVLSDIFSFLGDVIEWIGDAIVSILEEIGQLNAVVEGYYGCVDLPIGPYPPPFCEKINPLYEQALTNKVCAIAANGDPEESVSNNECVVSKLRNNYLNNTIRVSFDNFVPLCSGNEDPLLTDSCVKIENLDLFASPSSLHALTNRMDILPVCSSSTGGSPCVKTMIEHKCSVSANGCQDGFRVIYSISSGGHESPSSYYRDDIVDCPSATNAKCQKIWGVNTSEFVDVSVRFSGVQYSLVTSPATKTFNLTDSVDRQASFKAMVNRIAVEDIINDFYQYPNEICVYQDGDLVGCQKRALPPLPLLYECGSAEAIAAGINCTSNYFDPQFIASYKVNYNSPFGSNTKATDKIYTQVIPLSISFPAEMFSTINLAGVIYESFVTDSNFVKKPFSGPNSPNPTSLYGQYENDVKPVDGDTENKNAVYLRGLEYVNNKYRVGGRLACLETSDASKCPQNPKLCVLTKLENTATVKCSEYFKKVNQYGTIYKCDSNQTSECLLVDNIEGKVNIRKCTENDNDTEIIDYCYDGNIELCKTTYSAAERIDPSPDLGEYLSDNQYYDSSSISSGRPTGYMIKYNEDTQIIRDKTARERGLCVTVPLGSCAGQYDYSSDNGNASWPATKVGDKATGTCKSGYKYTGTLQRECLADPDEKSYYFEKLTEDKKCVPIN